jgi:hypothetical protein
MVNKTSPVRIRTTKNESGKRKPVTGGKEAVAAPTEKKAPAKKTAPKKSAK